MPDPWTDEEVRLAVEDYFSMLAAELRGDSYNKSAHRRRLKEKLNGRPDGSVERKHQNISAVLLEIGVPYVDGYKPLSNYQGLLREVVISHVQAHEDEIRLLAEEADAEIQPQHPGDLDSIVVPPPDAEPPDASKGHPGPSKPFDFAERDARNRRLGRLGEEFVLEFEDMRLRKAGRVDLAKRVEWVAERDSTAGFDILSFDPEGGERFLEVKTTNHGISFPFIISRNEVAFSESSFDRFELRRVFRYRRGPRMYVLPGAVSGSCRLEPDSYAARPAAGAA